MFRKYIVDYIITWQDSRNDLERKTQELIKMGWQPTGDVFRDDERHYCLQFVKYGRLKDVY